MHSGQQRRERVLPRTFDSSIRRECWESQPATSFVTVPEASVNEDNLAPASEHDVRAARKIARVEAKSITVAMQKTAEAQLRASMLPRIRAINALR